MWQWKTKVACLNQSQKVRAGVKNRAVTQRTEAEHPAGQISGPRRAPQSLTAAVVDLSMVLKPSPVRTMDSSVECCLDHKPEL